MPPARRDTPRLQLPHHRQVSVFQARPAHLQPADRLAVLLKQPTDEPGRLSRGLLEGPPVQSPAHGGLGRYLPGQLIGSTIGHDPATGQNENPVGELLRLGEVVRSQQNGGVLVREPTYQPVELAPGLRVQACRRLVQEQHLGFAHNADGHVKTPTLTAGQGSDPFVRLLRQPHGRDELVDFPRPPYEGGGVRRVVRAKVSQQLPHPPLAVVAPGLQHDAQARTPPLVPASRVGAQDGHVTGRAHPEAFQHLDRGRLARAVRAEQHDDFAPPGREADPLQYVLAAVAHPQIPYIDDRVAPRWWAAPNLGKGVSGRHRCSPIRLVVRHLGSGTPEAVPMPVVMGRVHICGYR